MKLQNLTVIFIIVILPILLIVSYYIGLQIDTINRQTAYDVKLQEATGEAISALEINSVEWNQKYSDLQDSKRRDVAASITTFVRSISNKMGLTNNANEYTLNYIPAAVYTMYDGYCLYANADTPEIQKDPNTNQAVLLDNGEVNYGSDNMYNYSYGHILQSYTPYSETLTNGNNVITINYSMFFLPIFLFLTLLCKIFLKKITKKNIFCLYT